MDYSSDVGIKKHNLFMSGVLRHVGRGRGFGIHVAERRGDHRKINPSLSSELSLQVIL